MDIRAYVALHLGGTPSQEIGTSPPSCLLLDICLYMSPISHIKMDMDTDFQFPLKIQSDYQ